MAVPIGGESNDGHDLGDEIVDGIGRGGEDVVVMGDTNVEHWCQLPGSEAIGSDVTGLERALLDGEIVGDVGWVVLGHGQWSDNE